MTTDEFWREFLTSTGKDPSAEYYECFYFDLTEESANTLLALVLSGEKTATSSSLPAIEHEGGRVPKPGDYSIVTDWNGNPRCVIETTAVVILPFDEMIFELCRREGEDGTLESWQNGHRRFFTEEGKMFGYEFREDMPVVFEDFRVVYRNRQTSL